MKNNRWADLFAMIERAQAGIPGASEQALVAVRFIVEDLQKTHQWQPIATAPKDGTRILACWSRWDEGGPSCEVVFWSDVREVWCQGTGGWGSDRWNDVEDYPTHWQSLPATPNVRRP